MPSSSGPYLGLGLAYARSGKCDQAIPYLEEYLRRKKQSPKPEAGDTLNPCKQRAVKPTGKLFVTSDPMGAEVRTRQGVADIVHGMPAWIRRPTAG